MHGHQTPVRSNKGKKHLKCALASDSVRFEKKKKENKSKYVWSPELSLVFCGLIGTRDEAAGIREEFLGVEAETYAAETRFKIVGEEKYTKSDKGKMNKGCQCVKNIMCNHGSYRKVKRYLELRLIRMSP